MNETAISNAEYENLLKEENPDFNFHISKTGLYRNGEGTVYQVDVDALKISEEFPSFSMVVDFYDYQDKDKIRFTEEEQKENFKQVAELTINAKIKEMENLVKEEKKLQEEQAAKK